MSDIFQADAETCTKCGACAEVCYLSLIGFSKGKLPKQHSASEKICTMCGACAIVCPSGSVILDGVPSEQFTPIDKSLAIDYKQCVQLIKTRRSIRAFKDRLVPRDTIERAIEAARYSPTANNSQNVQWLIFDEKADMGRLRALGGQWLVEYLRSNSTYVYLMDQLNAGAMEKRERSGVDVFLRGAPALVCAIAGRDPVAAIGCNIALAYFDIAVSTMGLGCCWVGFFTAAVNAYQPLKDFVRVPAGTQVYASMVLGYPKYEYRRIPFRKPADIIWHSGEPRHTSNGSGRT